MTSCVVVNVEFESKDSVLFHVRARLICFFLAVSFEHLATVPRQGHAPHPHHFTPLFEHQYEQ
jgi:hypothetical protein